MKLSKERASLDVGKFSFSQRVVQERMNKLPQGVIEFDATSVNQFKKRLDKCRKINGH